MVTAATSGSAPLLTEGKHFIFGSQNSGGEDLEISVVPGMAMYAGTTGANGPVFGHFGDGTVLDYKFFRSISNVPEPYTSGNVGLISDITTADTIIGNVNWVDLWTTTNPGYGFTNVADFTSNTMMVNISPTITGSVDIASMSEGIVYFIYGAYRSKPDIDLVMSGAGQTDITLVAS